LKELTQIKPVSWIKFDIYGLLMLGIDDCISHRGAENAEKRSLVKIGIGKGTKL